jgi:hypothetical protein
VVVVVAFVVGFAATARIVAREYRLVARGVVAAAVGCGFCQCRSHLMTPMKSKLRSQTG